MKLIVNLKSDVRWKTAAWTHLKKSFIVRMDRSKTTTIRSVQQVWCVPDTRRLPLGLSKFRVFQILDDYH